MGCNDKGGAAIYRSQAECKPYKPCGEECVPSPTTLKFSGKTYAAAPPLFGDGGAEAVPCETEYVAGKKFQVDTLAVRLLDLLPAEGAVTVTFQVGPGGNALVDTPLKLTFLQADPLIQIETGDPVVVNAGDVYGLKVTNIGLGEAEIRVTATVS